MKPWKIVAIPTAIMLVIAGIYMFSIYKKRHNPGVVNQAQEQKLTPDDVAVVKMQFPSDFDDLKDEEGKSLWMKNGYTMPYFPYAGGKVDFKKRVGVIPPLQKLEIKRAIKVAVPADVDDGISHGTRQAMYVFTFPPIRTTSRNMPPPWVRWREPRSSTTATCCSSTTTPTRSTPTGHPTYGQQWRRIRPSRK